MQRVAKNQSIVFRNVLVPVMQGSRLILVAKDVGVKAGRITHIVRPNSINVRQKETLVIEGEGHDVLSTGVADTHSHESLVLFHCAPEAPMADRSQGITHVLLGQDGLCVYPPLKEKYVPEGSVLGLEWAINQSVAAPPKPIWKTAGEYSGIIGQLSPQNSRVLIPYQTLRIQVTGEDGQKEELTPEQKAGLKNLIIGDLKAGCVGASLALEYVPGLHLKTAELIELGKILAEYNIASGTRFPIVVHMRSESDMVEEAVDEMLEVARESGVPIHISHLKTCQLSNIHKTEAVMAKLEAARREGLDIVADQHPYDRGSTFLNACIPQDMLAGDLAANLALLAQGTESRAKIAAMLKDLKTPTKWAHWIKWAGGPGGVIMVGLPNPEYAWCEGLNIEAAAKRVKQDPIEWYLDAMIANNLGGGQINANNTMANVRRILRQGWIGLGSDNVPGVKPHPRRYGSVARILGEEVRLGTLSLELALFKLCVLPKHRFWGETGLIEVGGRADLFLFDPARIRETATYTEPRKLCEGVRITMLNGAIVFDETQPNQPDELY